VSRAIRRAVRFPGVGRVIAHRRVVVSEALSGLSLHDAHGPPVDETIFYTLYGGHAGAP